MEPSFRRGLFFVSARLYTPTRKGCNKPTECRNAIHALPTKIQIRPAAGTGYYTPSRGARASVLGGAYTCFRGWHTSALGGTCVRSRGAHTPAGTPGLSIGLFRQNRRKGTSGRNPSDKPTTTLINHNRAHSPPLRGRIFPLLRGELFGEPPCIPPWILSASSNGSFDKKIPRFFPGDFIKIAPLLSFMDELSILS